MLAEFKAFIMRGNVMDLSVAVIMGTAFGSVVKTFTDAILMPPIGLLLGKTDFSNFYINLSEKTYSSYSAAKTAGAPVIGFGVFANTLINFVIIALAIFLLIQSMKRFEKSQPVAISTKTCPYCISDIPAKASRCPHCTSELLKES